MRRSDTRIRRTASSPSAGWRSRSQTPDGLRFATRDSFAGTILADAGVRQAGSLRGADEVLLARSPGAGGHVDGSFTRVDAALWFGDGGALAGKAALADLQRALGG